MFMESTIPGDSICNKCGDLPYFFDLLVSLYGDKIDYAELDKRPCKTIKNCKIRIKKNGIVLTVTLK